MRSSNWINVWNNISGKVPSRKKITLSKMIKLNAFGTTKGGLSSKYWLSYVNNILKLSKINKGDKVLEVGCGAGAFLYPFYKKGIKCFGVDYSKNLISVCKRAIKNGIFLTNRANNLRKFKNAYFDLVISNSVFQYFDNYHYTEKVIKEMIRVIKKQQLPFIM